MAWIVLSIPPQNMYSFPFEKATAVIEKSKSKLLTGSLVRASQILQVQSSEAEAS
jgi:hypothetical protein